MRRAFRRPQDPGNPRYRDIERAKQRLDQLDDPFVHVTAKAVNFIRDLYARGPNYRMSERQHQYLSSVLNQIRRIET